MRAHDLPITIHFDPSLPLDLAACPASRGVAVFEAADHRPIQIVATARLREAIARRLAPDDPHAPHQTAPRRADLRPIVRRVRAAVVGSSFEADLLFLRLAHDAMPATFRAVMDRRRGWFLHINPLDTFPRFTVIPTSAMPASIPDAGHLLGPVADKHAAQRLQQTLEDLFDLCRFHHILVKSPRATACAYKELGKCPAPCDGSETLDAYRLRVRAAIGFVRSPAPLIDDLTSQMEAASRATDFERAALHKSRLHAAQAIHHHKVRNAIGEIRHGWAVLATSTEPAALRAFVITPAGSMTLDTDAPEAIRAAAAPLAADTPATEFDAAALGLVCDALHRAPRKNERIIALSAPDWAEQLAIARRALSRASSSADDDSPEHEAEFTAEPQS